MAKPDDDGSFTRDEARVWLKDEIWAATKATQLRLQEATALVNDYLSGKLTQEEAGKKESQYRKRWGDSPIPGVFPDDTMSDEQILKAMEESRRRDMESSGNWTKNLDPKSFKRSR